MNIDLADTTSLMWAERMSGAMDAKQDDAMAHVAHAFGCQTCIDHGNENLRLAVQLQKLRKRNRKLRKRLREATGSP